MLKYTVKVKVKNCDVEFKDGMGEGVLGIAEISFPDVDESILEDDGLDNMMFHASLHDKGLEFVKELVELEYELQE